MKRIIAAIFMVAIAAPSYANDWEKFYKPLPFAAQRIPAQGEPEQVPSTGDADRDLESMWRNGFAPIGFSSFNSPNSKTADAVRLGKKLKANYVMIGTNLASSTPSSVPMTLPKTTTSVSNGNASVYGSNGGYASGTYSGTTTTYGSQTTYIPVTINRFDKLAVYFGEVPKMGLGIMSRDLTAQDVAAIETRRALPVRFVRDASPAYVSDLLPGDIITQVNGQPFSDSTLRAAVLAATPFTVHVYRNGQYRDIRITIPEGWQVTASAP